MFFPFIFSSVVLDNISLSPFSGSYPIYLHLKVFAILFTLFVLIGSLSIYKDFVYFQTLHTLLPEQKTASCFHKHLINILRLNAYGLVRISSIS